VNRPNSVALAWARYAEGRLSLAHQECSALIEDSEDHGHAWELLGLVFHDNGQFAAAADALERASLLIRVGPEARIALATAYGQLQRKRLATELYLELALVGNGEDELEPELLLQIAAGLESLDQPRLAMEVCRRADKVIRESGDDSAIAQVVYDMGFYSIRAGFPAHVTESLTRRAIDLEPQNPHFRVGLVSLLIQLDRFEEAFACAQSFSGQQISEVHCKCCLERIANLLHSFGDVQRAARCRERLGELTRSDSPANQRLQPEQVR